VDFDTRSQLLNIYSAFVKYLRKKWEYNEAVHQVFIDFEKAYDSIGREVLYNILIEFGIPVKLVRLIKLCLREMCSSVQVGKHLSDMFPITNGVKQGDASLTLLFNFALEYAIGRIQVNQDGLKLSGTHQLLVSADNVNILGTSIYTTQKNTEPVVIASKEIGLEVKLSTWFCLKTRMQGRVTIYRLTTVSLQG